MLKRDISYELFSREPEDWAQWAKREPSPSKKIVLLPQSPSPPPRRTPSPPPRAPYTPPPPTPPLHPLWGKVPSFPTPKLSPNERLPTPPPNFRLGTPEPGTDLVTGPKGHFIVDSWKNEPHPKDHP